MVRRCCVLGCRSSTGLHTFPVDFEIRRQWLRAISIESREFLPRSGVCNRHFSRDSFANLTAFELGYCKHLRLKRDAVPMLAFPGSSPQIPQLPQSSNMRRLEPKGTREIGCQTEPVINRNASVQANLNPAKRSKAIQVSCATGTWMETCFPESPSENLTPTKSKRCKLTVEDSSLDGSKSPFNCTNLDSPTDSGRRYHPDDMIGSSINVVVPDFCDRQVTISMVAHQPESIEVKIEPDETERQHTENHVSYSEGKEQSPDSFSHWDETMNIMCSSCGCTSQIQNVSDCTSAQLCLQCEFRNKFNGIDIKKEHSYFYTGNIKDHCELYSGSIEVTIEPEYTEHYVSDNEEADESKESDISDEEETADVGDVSSDEDWIPEEETLLTEEVEKSDSEEDSEEEELVEGEISSHGHRPRQLCAECGAFYYLEVHTCVPKTKPYVCNVCGKRCVTELSLKRHSNIHDESYEHSCKYCHVTFKTKNDKLAHQEIHQNTGKPYKCPHCPETFSSNKRRRIHLKIHGGPKEYRCEICGIKFWRNCHLKRHMIIHKGEKPFECSVCQRTFNQAGHLKSHKRVHTGEKPYKCKYCEESFNHNVSLKSHIQRHHTFDLGNIKDKTNPGIIKDTNEHSNTGADCVNISKEHDTKEVQQKRVKAKAKKIPPTGRPVGRPKRNTTDNGEKC